MFKKACLPVLEDLPGPAKDEYNNIVAGLGINTVGQAINDILNSWQIYLIAFGTVFIVTYNHATNTF